MNVLKRNSICWTDIFNYLRHLKDYSFGSTLINHPNFQCVARRTEIVQFGWFLHWYSVHVGNNVTSFQTASVQKKKIQTTLGIINRSDSLMRWCARYHFPHQQALSDTSENVGILFAQIC